MKVKTYGLPHVAMEVRNAGRSFRFYQDVLGVVEVYRKDGFIQAQTPGCRDVPVFEEAAARAGRAGGMMHFGFRLTDPVDITAAVQAVERAGGRILSQAEFCPGEPDVSFSIRTVTKSKSGASCRRRQIHGRRREVTDHSLSEK